MTANQPQITSLPLQVRCSNQPMGLRSSFRFIQRCKRSSITTGVQSLFFSQLPTGLGGRSFQLRFVIRAATSATRNKVIKESWSETATVTRTPLAREAGEPPVG